MHAESKGSSVCVSIREVEVGSHAGDMRQEIRQRLYQGRAVGGQERLSGGIESDGYVPVLWRMLISSHRKKQEGPSDHHRQVVARRLCGPNSHTLLTKSQGHEGAVLRHVDGVVGEPSCSFW